jgi:hypothetical protein
MKSPFYLTMIVLTCAYLAAANLRGWNPLYFAAANLWRSHAASTHK